MNYPDINETDQSSSKTGNVKVVQRFDFNFMQKNQVKRESTVCYGINESMDVGKCLMLDSDESIKRAKEKLLSGECRGHNSKNPGVTRDMVFAHSRDLEEAIKNAGERH